MPTDLPVWAESVRLRLIRLTRPELPSELASPHVVPTLNTDPTPYVDASLRTEMIEAWREGDTSESQVPKPSEPPPRRWRLDPGRRGIRALAVVVVVIALLAGAVAWWTRPRPQPVTVVPMHPPGATPNVSASTVVVAVSGKVRRPGLVRASPGARVADVLEMAGGPLPDVDLSQLNIARKVNDGELVVIGAPAPAGGSSVTSGGAGKVNLNTATLTELDTLPGVGPVMAQRILDYRAAHGQFQDVMELRHVDGIGNSKFERLKDLVTL